MLFFKKFLLLAVFIATIAQATTCYTAVNGFISIAKTTANFSKNTSDTSQKISKLGEKARARREKVEKIEKLLKNIKKVRELNYKILSEIEFYRGSKI